MASLFTIDQRTVSKARFAVGLGVIAWAAVPAVAAALSVERVTIPAERVPLTKFAESRADTNPGLSRARRRLPAIQVEIYRPSDNSAPGVRWPTVVLSAGCAGVTDTQRWWARRLAEWGYVAAIPDLHGAHGWPRDCLWPRRQLSSAVLELFRVRRHLGQLSFVDPIRIGVAGWDYGPSLSAVARNGPRLLFAHQFQVAIAFYPDCGPFRSGHFLRATLILNGSEDARSPLAQCVALENASRRYLKSTQLITLSGASHGFDQASAKPARVAKYERNFYANPARGVEYRFDPSARERAADEVRRFLESQLRRGPVVASMDQLFEAAPVGKDIDAHWVNSIVEPGPDLPTAGASLFDRWLATLGRSDNARPVPWPLEELIERLSEDLEPRSGGDSSLKRVLIPQGRSLQRDAAAPHYFHHPRIVLAVDEDPREASDGRRLFLKDRLYLGFQEKSETLEVISYNEAMQRFEFQVVRGYGEGGRQEIFYAPRRVCISCHQHHGPIFPNAPWDETNSNRDIVARLMKINTHYHGLLVRDPDVNRIDRSANRAILLPVLQRSLADVCPARGVAAEAECRIRLLEAMVQYRLTSFSTFNTASESHRRMARHVSQTWSDLWPQGVFIPSANIPDRNPIKTGFVIRGVQDPIAPRPPLAVWRGDDPKLILNVVRELATDVPEGDLRRLDDFLRSQRVNKTLKSQTRLFSCEILGGYVSSLRFLRGRFTCSENRSLDAGMTGDFEIDLESRIFSASRISLTLGDDHIPELNIAGSPLEPVTPGRFSASGSLRYLRVKTGVRLPDGRAIGAPRFLFRSDEAGISSGREKVTDLDADFSLRLAVIDDYALVRQALSVIEARLARGETVPGFGRFLDTPRAMQTLLREMSAPVIGNCCHAADGLPDQRLEALSLPVNVVRESLKPVYRYCGQCHGGPTDVPPGFLHGEPETVLQQLRRCAPRMRYRLSMWQLPLAERPRSTMPPFVPAATDTDSHGTRWSQSLAYQQVLDTLSLFSRAPSIESTVPVEHDYDSLPPCHRSVPVR